jgi:SAM-dependent methyltransferase
MSGPSTTSGVEHPFGVRIAFYSEVVRRWLPDKSTSVLVVAGGKNDREVFLRSGFSDVVISNLDDRMKAEDFAPYAWSFEDLNDLSYSDEAFDYVVVHAGLHHCPSPHRALLEMYRVARKAVVLVENRDSLLLRLAVRFGLVPDHEVWAVFSHGGRYGGVNNTEIPNYVYRWSEREIEKTVHSYAPHAKHQIDFAHGFDIPRVRVSSLRSLAIRAARPVFSLLFGLLPRQKNLFAARIRKPALPDDLHPWVTLRDGEVGFDRAWASKEFGDSTGP